LHFFLIQKLKNKTLKSTSGEIDPARETVSGEIWHREIPSRERFSASFGNIRRERAFPSRSGERERVRQVPGRSGREIPSREIFWREMDSGEREREREREIFRRNPAAIPSKEGLPAAGERDLPVKKTKRERTEKREKERGGSRRGRGTFGILKEETKKLKIKIKIHVG